METLWRTGLVCTVIAIVFATEVEGGRRDEFVHSQGECRWGAEENHTNGSGMSVNLVEQAPVLPVSHSPSSQKSHFSSETRLSVGLVSRSRFGWISALAFWEQPYLISATRTAKNNLVV